MGEITGANANKNLLVRDMDDAHFKENGETIELKNPPETPVGYKQNAPNTVTDVVAMVGMPLDAGSTDWLTTNRAAEAGADGVRNPDGLMGFQSPTVRDPVEVLEYNGATLIVGQDNVATLPSGKYTGQVVNITNDSTTNPEVAVSTPSFFWGISRNSLQNNAFKRMHPNNPPLIIKWQETVTLRWNSGFWHVVASNQFLQSGPGWRENEDGTVTQYGLILIDPADSGLVKEIILPVSFSNPVSYTNVICLELTALNGVNGLDGEATSPSFMNFDENLSTVGFRDMGEVNKFGITFPTFVLPGTGLCSWKLDTKGVSIL